MPRPFKLGAVSIAVIALVLGAVGMTVAFQPGPAYLSVQSFSANASGPNAVKLSASTNADSSASLKLFHQSVFGQTSASLNTGPCQAAGTSPAGSAGGSITAHADRAAASAARTNGRAG